MATEERVCIVFKPAPGKNAGDVSRQLPVIEAIIRGAGGNDFRIHPHDHAAFCFTLEAGATEIQAETIVHALNRLNDVDGRPVVDAEQGGVSIPQISVTQPQIIGGAAPR